ncbi:primosomal protein N' [Actinokineospora sp. G85]|uniref:primosomal protein N' n=1 Tax=Actinokineospora sp. G85 TaxID=3406626 RepID=UPI003C735668
MATPPASADALFEVTIPKPTPPKGAAAELPVARVCVEVSAHNVNKLFEYWVPASAADTAVPGCRVRVRFSGQLVAGFLIERVAEAEYERDLMLLEQVVSPEPVLTPQTVELCRAVAERYAGNLCDVLKEAVPARRPKPETEPPPEPVPAPPRPGAEAWSRYQWGPAFLNAVHAGRQAHAVWQALPGEDWPARLAEVAATAAAGGRGAVVVVPDHRDVARVHAACVALVGEGAAVALSADQGPSARYRSWLSVRRGGPRIAVGARSTAYAPVADPGVLVVWDDGDDQHSEISAPFTHARDVLITRAELTGAAVLVAGFARTAEAQRLVDTGWAVQLAATRDQLRAAAPRVTALGEHDSQLARDEAARTARIPAVAFEAARAALGAGRPVLVQVPRRGYVPALTCQDCRAPARCRRCAGPLQLPGDSPPTCHWCAAVDANHRCSACGSRKLRAAVVGAKRTAEELGRSFPGHPIRTSGGSDILASVPAKPALVIATPGAEPVAEGGYGAALLLDGWALLGRSDLRATEKALRHWMAAAGMVVPATQGGRVVVLADSTLAPVQALVRWDPAWHASLELAGRTELGFPPAVRMAAVDGTPEAVATLLNALALPDNGEILGPVPLDDQGTTERALIRVPRPQGHELAAALSTALTSRVVRKDPAPARVRMDPQDLV